MEGGVSLKEYLETVIDLKITGVKDLVEQARRSSKEALDIFSKNNDQHHEKLNNTYTNVKEIADSKVSNDKFEAFKDEVERRQGVTDAYIALQTGKSKVSEAAKLVIAGLAGSLLTVLGNYILNHI